MLTLDGEVAADMEREFQIEHRAPPRTQRSSLRINKALSGFEQGGRALRGGDRRRRHRLTEEFAHEFAEGLVGWTVAGMVDIMLQVIEQLIGGSIAFIEVSRECAMDDLV